MRILLDTQLYLWFLADSSKLSKKVRKTIAESDMVFVSAASIWEAAIKVGLGRLAVSMDDLLQGCEGSGCLEVQLTGRQTAHLSPLPPHHRAPFARLFIAQSIDVPHPLLPSATSLQLYSDLLELV